MHIKTYKVAILSTNGFEQSELMSPRDHLLANDVEVDIVSPEAGTIKGWKDGSWGDSVKVDVTLEDAKASDYDALVLPGGVINPDALRINEKALAFTRDFFTQHKPVAAICHGPWVLINAEVVKGRRMTSYPSIRADLENAGALWEDSEVVVDQGLVTSRSPKDLDVFNAKVLEELREGRHEKQRATA